MNRIYDEAFRIILGHEGGYQNIHNDRGNWTTGIIGKGENKGTKFGLTAMTYPHLDIKRLTVDSAKTIYKKDFWDRIAGDNLYPALALVAFDTAVNSGVGTSKRFLNKVTNDAAGVAKFLALRRQYIRSLKLYSVVPTGSRSGKTYGQIWETRINQLEKQARDFERMFPVASQEGQEGASEEFQGVQVLLDTGEGFKTLTEPLKTGKLDISTLGNKVYIRAYL